MLSSQLQDLYVCRLTSVNHLLEVYYFEYKVISVENSYGVQSISVGCLGEADSVCSCTCRCKCCNPASNSRGACWCVLAGWGITEEYYWPRYHFPKLHKKLLHMYWNLAVLSLLDFFPCKIDVKSILHEVPILVSVVHFSIN